MVILFPLPNAWGSQQHNAPFPYAQCVLVDRQHVNSYPAAARQPGCQIKLKGRRPYRPSTLLRGGMKIQGEEYVYGLAEMNQSP